jgi:hypothetical protein
LLRDRKTCQGRVEGKIAARDLVDLSLPTLRESPL